MPATAASMAVGRRIRLAREGKGWTQAQLAGFLGRTPTSISYWEGGQRSPGLEDIVGLAEVLGVPASQLLPSRPPRVLARAQAEELAIADLARVVDTLVDRYETEPSLSPVPHLGATNPAEAAALARREAGQNDPPIAIEPIMDHFHVRFTREPLPDALSGLVVFVGETPVIAVDGDELEERQRFTAAHELGHVLLAHHDTFHVDLARSDGIPPEYNWRHERAANEFAAALLMPAPNLRNDVQNLVNVNPVTLARRYEVSVQAMSIRLSTLGLRT